MHAYLLTGIELSPTAMERLVAVIPDPDQALTPDRFTPREILAHLADWEPIMRDRISQAVDHPGSNIDAYDEGQMAIDNRYSEKDVAESLATFKSERKRTVEFVKGLRSEVLGNTVTHPERGEMTVLDLTVLLLGHDMYHVEQLTAHLSHLE